ncbi:MAG: aminotransferase [Proteobacteria bacterium]|nr:aminotransferase [Pseudomonadota bacterium]
MRDRRDLAELDKQSLLHPFTSISEHLEGGPRIMDRAQGVIIRDRDGREYIDAMAGLWCVNVGYGREEIAHAMAEQARRLPFYHSFASSSNEPAIRLAERLLRDAPGQPSVVFFANSGSEANETQVKLVWYYNNLRGKPAKKKIIARTGGYHGVTLGAASLSGLPLLHGSFDLPLPGFLHVTKPHHYREARDGESEREFSARLARELEELILREGPETVAAFVAEPVMAAGGVIPPPEGYFEAIVPVLREYDVLFIADEVVCGFGRLGTAYGSDTFALEPDLVTVAKGLTSAYFPMSAAIVSEKVWGVLRERSAPHGPFGHGHTTSAHPVGAAAALANLDILEGEKLAQRAARVGAHLQTRLRDALSGHPLVGEVRGLGLIAGVELAPSGSGRGEFDASLGVGRRLAERLLDEGLICRALGNTLAFSPPLVISEAEVDEVVDRFGRGLDRLTGELEAEGVA